MAALLGQGAMATRQTLLPSWLEISVNISRVTCACGAGRAKAQELITQVASGLNNPWETGKIRCNCCSISSTQSYTRTQMIYVIDP